MGELAPPSVEVSSNASPFVFSRQRTNADLSHLPVFSRLLYEPLSRGTQRTEKDVNILKGSWCFFSGKIPKEKNDASTNEQPSNNFS